MEGLETHENGLYNPWYKENLIFKLRLGALIPRFVFLSVCPFVCPPKITKNYKTLQNLTKYYKAWENDELRFVLPSPPLSCVKTVKEA